MTIGLSPFSRPVFNRNRRVFQSVKVAHRDQTLRLREKAFVPSGLRIFL